MMTLENFTTVLIKDKKVILLFLVVFLGLSFIYCIFIYKPIYVSESKVMLEEVAPITFVTELGKGRNLETNSQEKNPVLTQIEVLSSQDMAKRVFYSLNNQHIFKDIKSLQEESLIQAIKNSIKLKTPPATDVIEVKVAWINPSMSYLINKILLEEYRKYNIEINKESNSQAKQFIQEQLQRSTFELQQIRKKIENFKRTNASVDLNTESSLVTKEMEDAQDNLFNLDSQISYHRRKVAEYLSRLHINSGQVNSLIKSVALGQNSNLLNLYRDLNTAEQQYSSLKVRYPETTKKVTTQKSAMDEIKRQIQKQILVTTGPAAYQNDILVQDSIRTQLVNDLISNQAESLSLNAKRKSLLDRLEKLKLHQLKIPEVQANLVALTDKEANLSSIINALTSKLVEAKVRESGIISNIDIVQIPTYPHQASFPSQSYLILIMSVLGISVGCFVVLARYYLLDIVTNSYELETILNSSVIGELTNTSGLNSQSMRAQISVEFERIVTALKLAREDKNINVFGFTSLRSDISPSGIISSIARLLSNCNRTVLILDADFREGNIAQEFGMNSRLLPDFKELLSDETKWEHITIRELVPLNSEANIGESISFSDDRYVSNISDYLTKVETENSVYLMTHTGNCLNPYQLIANKYLPQLIDQARARFDYVLLSLPPLDRFSDALVISRAMDGMVAITPSDVCRARLSSIYELLQHNCLKILGVILVKFK